jgi:hypothetical protein
VVSKSSKLFYHQADYDKSFQSLALSRQPSTMRGMLSIRSKLVLVGYIKLLCNYITSTEPLSVNVRLINIRQQHQDLTVDYWCLYAIIPLSTDASVLIFLKLW